MLQAINNQNNWKSNPNPGLASHIPFWQKLKVNFRQAKIKSNSPKCWRGEKTAKSSGPPGTDCELFSYMNVAFPN